MIEPLNICVMLGGDSRERAVSIKSGVAVAEALRSIGHRVCEIDPVDGEFELPLETDVVFIALHGTYGEDGTLQAKLDSLGVPYTGCGEAASRIAFDKIVTFCKSVMRAEKSKSPSITPPPLLIVHGK